ncbi:CopG family transcriptional regulator [Sphingomonas melonis TY]|uniref:CopG family transcriptional regulator n=1 Tax=Sphingomonas melonis TY TaxID=621456 RepID=A0A175Y1E0_9SPHN|nr:hypothetical protein [Sphingomonas melonis]AOW24588.1 CopG family transcriptional regulator [Sphingomonas melonis TY]KZB94245.1 CopG family transcriptional regulator [Sphingomonas melonis TY]
MAITPRPKPVASAASTAAQDAFISGAPDASPVLKDAPAEYEKGIKKGNKRQITLTIAPDLLERVDQVARRTGQARAAVINMAIFQAIEGDLFRS